MRIEFFYKLMAFLFFCLVQALVFNQMHVLGFATPLLYVYFIIKFRYNYPHWGLMLWGFVMGVTLDTFSNTPGVASASMTLLSAVRPALLALFVPRDSSPELVPSFSSLGTARFVYYTMMMVIIYCVVFFSLEMFTIFNVLYWAESILGSMALTVVLILVMENVRREK